MQEILSQKELTDHVRNGRLMLLGVSIAFSAYTFSLMHDVSDLKKQITALKKELNSSDIQQIAVLNYVVKALAKQENQTQIVDRAQTVILCEHEHLLSKLKKGVVIEGEMQLQQNKVIKELVRVAPSTFKVKL